MQHIHSKPGDFEDPVGLAMATWPSGDHDQPVQVSEGPLEIWGPTELAHFSPVVSLMYGCKCKYSNIYWKI